MKRMFFREKEVASLSPLWFLLTNEIGKIGGSRTKTEQRISEKKVC